MEDLDKDINRGWRGKSQSCRGLLVGKANCEYLAVDQWFRKDSFAHDLRYGAIWASPHILRLGNKNSPTVKTGGAVYGCVR